MTSSVRPSSPPFEMTAIPIGFLRHNFLGRSETFIYNSLRGIEEGGRYHVRVFALRRLLDGHFPWNDVTRPNLLGRVLYFATRFTPAFTRWARSVRLIHAHLAPSSPFAMAAAARARIPFVVSYYGHDVGMYKTRERFATFAWWYTLLRRRVLARAARVVVLSEHMKRALVAQGCPEEKLAIVRLGIDLARFDIEHTPSPGPLRILMVGREVDKKGFDDGVRACAALRDRGVAFSLSIQGTHGPLHDSLRSLADDLRVPVTWIAPSATVPSSLAAADVLLAPSRIAADGDEEGTPTVIAEASAARLPIVSTTHAGIPEQVDDGETGFLVGERDPRALADALTVLARDPARRHAMGLAGRAKVTRDYSLATHRARLEALYSAVLEHSP